MSRFVSAIKRIVVQVTAQEKHFIVEKARELNITGSEVMRRGATEYAPVNSDLVELAKAAQVSAARSMTAMDEALTSIAVSNARIAAMEAKVRADRQERLAEMTGSVSC